MLATDCGIFPWKETAMFNPIKLQEMLSKAGQVQEEMQRKLSQTQIEGASGGGAVTVLMNGKKQLLRLQIDPAAVASLSGESPDLEMLQDLIVAAVNDAGNKAEQNLKSQLTGLLGGLSIPGLS
jgi:DNA-binding YbaB/EbfC family protein